MTEGPVIDLSHGWQFVRGRVYAKWLGGKPGGGDIEVDLPHCWNTEDTFQEGVKYYRGSGAYRKTLRLPGVDPDTVWFLETDGFYGEGEVWVNGQQVAEVDGNFLGFQIDITAQVTRDKENVIGIKLSNKHRADVLPGIREPDFVLHGGLAGKVRLRTRPGVHLVRTDWRVQTGLGAAVTLNVPVRNTTDDTRNLVLRWQVRDQRGGDPVSRQQVLELSPGKIITAEITMEIPDPIRWDVDDPHRYTMQAELLEGGQVLDRIDGRFGLRDAEFRRDDGFFLNGRRLELRGINRHESMPGMGNALPEELHVEDAQRIKDMGLNLVRLSHYPQSPAFLDACDALGILVYAEICTWKSVRGGRWLDRACRQLEGMIRRDRHHPSVILWGLGNESRHAKAYARLTGIVRALDPGRPTIYAENHLYRAQREGTLQATDVYGMNYELDVLEEAREASANRVLLLSEMSNCPVWRGDPEEERKQLETIKADLQQIENKPYVAGFTLWCMNDYATLRKDRYRRPSGVCDAWRQPKFAAHLVSAMFAKKPFVYAWGDWSVGSRNASREVHLFSSCDHVSIFVGGAKWQTLNLAHTPHFMTRIPFENDRLRFVGHHPNGDVAFDLHPYGAAHRLALAFEGDASGDLYGELLVLDLRVVDAGGHTVLDQHGRAVVTVDGPARVFDWNPYGQYDYTRGTGRIFLTGKREAGEVVVTAFAPDLKPAVIKF